LNKLLLTEQVATHSKMLSLQRIYRYITSPLFEEAYDRAAPQERDLVLKYIREGDKDRIVQWVRLNIRREKDYESYTVSELRETAKHLGIRNYTHLTRDDLLIEILNKKRNHGTNIQRTEESTQRESIQS
jgi:hypothetical protein